MCKEEEVPGVKAKVGYNLRVSFRDLLDLPTTLVWTQL